MALTANVERSREYNTRSAETYSALPITHELRTILLTCMDPRVDPADVLGIERGDAVVIRNAGGRVTPEFFRSLGILGVVAQKEGLPREIDLVVMHHTDCGLCRLTDPEYAELMGGYLGTSSDEVEGHHLADPAEAVRLDVAKLQANPLVPETLTITGAVLDLDTGLVSFQD